ncbi:MAG: ABC transporter permease [Ideonella sp.]
MSARPRLALALRAVLAREWNWLRASPWDLAMISVIPLGACALVAWIFIAGLPRDLPVVLIDQDHSAVSRQLARALDASPGIAVATQVDDWQQALSLLRSRQAYGVVILPEHLASDLQTGRSATVQWFYNGQYQSHVGGLGRDVRAVVSTFSAGIELAAREKRGAAPVVARAQFEPLRLQVATLFNENSNYEFFLGLALMPAIAQIFITLAVVSSIGRELRRSTVPDWLSAAGERWWLAVAGKLVWPALSFGLQALLFVAVFALGLGWTVQGSLAMLLAGMLALVAAQLAMGVLLIGATLALRNALSATAFVTAPAFAFAGQGFPLQSMPAAARWWAETLPLTHYLQLQSRHWLAGAPAAYSSTDLLVLLLMAAGMGGLGLLLLQLRAHRPHAWGRT